MLCVSGVGQTVGIAIGVIIGVLIIIAVIIIVVVLLLHKKRSHHFLFCKLYLTVVFGVFTLIQSMICYQTPISAAIFTARCYAERGYATALLSRSVRLWR